MYSRPTLYRGEYVRAKLPLHKGKGSFIGQYPVFAGLRLYSEIIPRREQAPALRIFPA